MDVYYRTLLGIVWLLSLFAPIVCQAVTTDELKQKVEALDDQCRGGASIDSETEKTCDSRESILKELERRGWCWGHAGEPEFQKDWEKCGNRFDAPTDKNISADPRNPIFPKAGSWFLQVHQLLLDQQLRMCANYAAAGNEILASSCYSQTLNAHDFLMKRAQESRVPAVGWSFCASEISANMAFGAQCLIVEEQICPLRSDGNFADYPRCAELMTSGAWVANPVIAAPTFDYPIRTPTPAR